jgi:hypothetical protein
LVDVLSSSDEVPLTPALSQGRNDAVEEEKSHAKSAKGAKEERFGLV